MSPEVEANEIVVRSEMMDIAPAQRKKPDDVFDFGPAGKAIVSLAASGWKPKP